MRNIIIMILCACLFLTGCDTTVSYFGIGLQNSQNAQQSAAPLPQATAAVASYALRFSTGLNLSMRSPKTFNPLVNEDISVNRVLRLLFEPLCEVRDNMRPTPNLLSRVEFASDGMSAACTIREDIYWSDGVKMSAGDVQFSVQAIKNENGSELYKRIIEDIDSIDIIDNSNFRVRFNKPQGGVCYSLCFPAIPKHYYSGEIREDSRTALAPVGNGVYELASIDSMRKISLKNNENSFKNKPYIERVTVLILDDNKTDMQAFDQNIIDAVDSNYLAFGKYSGSKDIVTTAYNTNNYVFMGFNFQNVLFEDNMIRQAIAHSVDKDQIVESIYLNNAKKAGSVINPSSYMYEPDLKAYEFNMNEAKNILFSAGYRDNDLDGILDKEMSGFTMALKFRLLVNEENTERMKVAQTIKNNLEQLNFVIEIDSCDFESYMAKVQSGDYDMFIGTFNLDIKPDFRFFLHSESAGESGNYFHYKSDYLDMLIKDAESAKTETELRVALASIQKHVAQELPCISIAFVQGALLSDAGIKGNKKPVMGNIFFNVEEWKIE